MRNTLAAFSVELKTLQGVRGAAYAPRRPPFRGDHRGVIEVARRA